MYKLLSLEGEMNMKFSESHPRPRKLVLSPVLRDIRLRMKEYLKVE